jgi:hypothetical protein
MRICYISAYMNYTNQVCRLLERKAAMAELTYVLCQHGETLRKQKSEHPPWLSNVQAGMFAEVLGRKVKSTAHENIPTQQSTAAALGPGLVLCT